MQKRTAGETPQDLTMPRDLRLERKAFTHVVGFADISRLQDEIAAEDDVQRERNRKQSFADARAMLDAQMAEVARQKVRTLSAVLLQRREKVRTSHAFSSALAATGLDHEPPRSAHELLAHELLAHTHSSALATTGFDHRSPLSATTWITDPRGPRWGLSADIEISAHTAVVSTPALPQAEGQTPAAMCRRAQTRCIGCVDQHTKACMPSCTDQLHGARGVQEAERQQRKREEAEMTESIARFRQEEWQRLQAHRRAQAEQRSRLGAQVAEARASQAAAAEQVWPRARAGRAASRPGWDTACVLPVHCLCTACTMPVYCLYTAGATVRKAGLHTL